jgi:hypothetical protein
MRSGRPAGRRSPGQPVHAPGAGFHVGSHRHRVCHGSFRSRHTYRGRCRRHAAGVGRCRGNGDPNQPDGCRRGTGSNSGPGGAPGRGNHWQRSPPLCRPRQRAGTDRLSSGGHIGQCAGLRRSSRGGDYNNVYSSLEHRWPARKGADAFGSPESVDTKDRRAKGG